jgi:hypothetical protein
MMASLVGMITIGLTLSMWNKRELVENYESG